MPRFLTLRPNWLLVFVGIAIGALLVSGHTALMISAVVVLGCMLLLEVLDRIGWLLLIVASFVMANRAELWPPDVAPVMPWAWGVGFSVALIVCWIAWLAGWSAHVEAQRREGVERVEKMAREEKKVR